MGIQGKVSQCDDREGNALATGHFPKPPVNPENPDGSHHPVVFAFSTPFTQPHVRL